MLLKESDRSSASVVFAQAPAGSAADSLPLLAGGLGDRLRVRREYRMGTDHWRKIRDEALRQSLSPLSPLLAVLGEVMGRWNGGEAWTLLVDAARAGSPATDSGSGQGEAAVSSMRWKTDGTESFQDLCRALEAQLSADGESGYDADGEDGNAVVRFSIGRSWQGTEEEVLQPIACLERQEVVWLNCRAEEQDGELRLIWAGAEDRMPREQAGAMFETYVKLLIWTATEEWTQRLPDGLPEEQRAVRDQANATALFLAEAPIHAAFFAKAKETPERPALLWEEGGVSRSWSYGELADKALRLAARLIARGVGPEQRVAVKLPRGPEQIAAVFAVLAAGAAYVPVHPDQPSERRERIYRIGSIRHILLEDSDYSQLSESERLSGIRFGEPENMEPLPAPRVAATDALAYVIFTSGSTGEPKGVEITHRAAWNTIQDINRKFAVRETDNVLAVSSLEFDLSVYDLFGLLSVGGGVVLLNEGIRREAAVWTRLVRRMKVTVWNSVPALLDMLLAAANESGDLASLRLALVSGDWIGLELPDRLRAKSPNCRFIALGGATEAAVWSNYFEVRRLHPSWRSIPYGRPLSNQLYRVVDRLGRDCPDLVAGELWIGGAGVARGYLSRPELTAASFVEAGGERWYRTGDRGRYWPDGTLEFLGRADRQIKLRGYRIEPGEIEAALRRHAGVGQAVAAVADSGASQLVAVVVPAVGGEPGPVEEAGELRIAAQANQEAGGAEWESQARIVEAFIAEVLLLAEGQDDPAGPGRMAETLRVAEEYAPLLRLWLAWLEERQIVVCGRSGEIRGGSRLPETLRYAEACKLASEDGEDGSDKALPLAEQIAGRLFRRTTDYRQIIGGELPASVLLEDDLLAPERLAARDTGTTAGIAMIAAAVKRMHAACGRPAEVALLGGRGGIAAKTLLEQLTPDEIKLTLLDTAPSLLEAARERLSSLPYDVQFHRLPENRVPSSLRYAFDVVAAVHSLHRYRDPREGTAVAAMLARRGGRVAALEQRELTPIAIVTSAVLDKGFAQFDDSRRQARSPMLPEEAWIKLLRQAGLRQVRALPIAGSSSFCLEADCPASRPELKEEELLRFAAGLLQAHMLPERIEIVPQLPLTANGKVDRKAVSELFHSQMDAAEGGEPRDGMERAVADMWRRLLKRDTIGRESSFFAIGGDSLLATRFLAETKESFGIDLSLRQLFEAPTLERVAAVLEPLAHGRAPVAEALEEGEI
ncbi:amino acid adenylation domain-containing protein [Cohnella cellulosilytica]|uniref:Amino acid adenylation domain-containing protein n=1 Tax=Cohnella cellulosilytica TaxID=986710 RepID=A0ABW2FNU8_9BACL